MILGLGSQVRAHIERRFSAQWSHPAARMREFVLAMRAVWASWNDGTRLDFNGDFYTHTLMTPVFAPRPNPSGAPRVFLAAVGPLMTEVAGEVADGVITHGVSSPRYLREVTLPALERGLAKSGRTRADVEVTCPGFIAVADTEAQLPKARAAHAPPPLVLRIDARRTVRCSSCTGGAISRPSCTRARSGASGMSMAGLVDDDMLDAFDDHRDAGHRSLRRSAPATAASPTGSPCRGGARTWWPGRQRRAADVVSDVRRLHRARATSGSPRSLAEGARFTVGDRERVADLGEGGGAFAAYVDGEPVVDIWTGDAASGVAVVGATRNAVIMSATKGITAVCAHVLADRGELDVDAPVGRYWPEFGAAGKEPTLVRQLLSHQSGAIGVPGADRLLSWDGSGWSDTVGDRGRRSRPRRRRGSPAPATATTG